MKKIILFLLIGLLLVLPVTAEEAVLQAGVYHASDIDYLYLLDAADGSQIAQFITTDGLGNETFSLTAEWNGMSGSLVKNGQTIHFTAEKQDDEAIYINQDIFLFEELSGFYMSSEKKIDITETTAMLLIEHIPAMKQLLGEDFQWQLSPMLVDNLFYSLSAVREDTVLAEFFVLRTGGAIFRMDGASPQLIYGTLQNMLDRLVEDTGEIMLSAGFGVKAVQPELRIPHALQPFLTYSSSNTQIFRVNSSGRMLPRQNGSAQLILCLSLENEQVQTAIPVTVIP